MFTPQGSWVPDQPINNQVPNQNMGAVPQMRPTLQMNPQVPMQFNPQMNPFVGNQMTMAGHSSNPTGQYPITPNIGNNPIQTTQPQAQGQQMPYASPNQGQPQQPLNFGLLQNSVQRNIPDMVGQGPSPIQQVYSPQSQQAPLSLTQSVNHTSPQGVQNYLKALHNSPQLSQGNAWRNPQGMQGQGAQAGFQGFQQNGVQNYGQQAVQYKQPQAGQQLGQSNTTATPGQQQMGGGTGGVAGQPQYKVAGDMGVMGNKQQSQSPNGFIDDQKAASDINVKQDIKQGDVQLQEFLDSLGVYDYEYKDPKYGEGRRISPMAQEIEKTPLGKAAISTNDEGYKIVDYGKLGGTMLASLAMLNHKYNELEESIKKGLKSKGKIK